MNSLSIGITFDLRDFYLAAGYSELETAEFDSIETIDAIDGALQSLGHQTERIGNARELIGQLASGNRWDLVFNICEGLRGNGRESQVPAILDVFEIPYTFADPCCMSVCLNKGVTKSMIAKAGLLTPNFAVVRSAKELWRFLDQQKLTYPLFAKPIAEGTGKGVTSDSKITTEADLVCLVQDLLARFDQAVLIEEFLPGREFTVGLIGTGDQARCLGTSEILLLTGAEPEVYSIRNKEHWVGAVDYRYLSPDSDPTVCEVEELALAAWRVLDCRDAGRIDIRCDRHGKPQFIEANPLAGLRPDYSDLPNIALANGHSYIEFIQMIIESAKTRVRPPITASATSKSEFATAKRSAL